MVECSEVALFEKAFVLVLFGEISPKGVVDSFCILNHSIKKIIKFSFKLIYEQVN